MPVSVEKVAKAARLNLTPDEKKRFQKDMDSIVEAFSLLDEVKADCEPSFQPLPVKGTLRSDSEEKSLSQKDALANTKHKERGYFKGPRAV
ncbi:MAG: Asp-tRNA(Asn)/Glu-tRNA(Gln) amidotransferase subunit GatC [Candidatus Aenigmarchaeota archaeon]|nr:Asp-tRNA(Asn)/Glu-tRNA(Gln) amidotransferase subunit GatC [Candidatus Aenigmarchaeota archaeon]